MSSDSAGKKYVAFIKVKPIVNELIVTAIDLTTQKHVPRLFKCIENKNIKEFVNDIPKYFGKNFKAIIVGVNMMHSPDFSSNLDFCKAIREKLDLVNVPYHFIKDDAYGFILPLYVANITVKIGETIAVVIMMESIYRAIYLTLTPNGYQGSDYHNISLDLNGDNGKKIRAKISGNFNPKEIVILADKELEILKKKLPSAHCINFEDLSKFEIPWLIDYSKWMDDKSSVNTLLIPKVNKLYFLYKRFGEKINVEYFVANGTHALPFTKSWTLPKSHCQYVIAIIEPLKDTVSPIMLLNQCKVHYGNIVTFDIDINNFPTCSIQGTPIVEIQTMPAALNKNVKTKIPVIGFYGNLSVICVYKDDQNYEFLDSWGGMNGSELYISFDEETPKFGEAALAMIGAKPTYVVYDILKIMSMPPNKVEIDNTWPFKITKDAENPVLLEFDNFDSEKSAAPPSFLMAMLLKQHLKAIKGATKEKPKQIGFCFLEKDAASNQRLKNQLVDSCKLLKISCRFFNV